MQGLFCVIDNGANVQWHHEGLHNMFDDDCGACYNTYPYLQDGDDSGTLKWSYWEAASTAKN